MIGKITVRPVLFLLLFVFPLFAKAQPLLPDMIGTNQNGINVLTWISQYDGIKSIAVQRSQDSMYNYTTIGFVKDLKKGTQAFLDGHPAPGNNWYRLYIVFTSDLTWYSNRLNLAVDSSAIMAQTVLPPNDSLQKFATRVKTIEEPVAVAAGHSNSRTKHSNMKTTLDTTRAVSTSAATTADTATMTPVISVPKITKDIDPSTYIKSQYVFTNPFTGHVNIEIPEAKQAQYSIRFFDQRNRMIFEVPRISESSIILDKRNFQRKGIFKFELSKDKSKLESGYITIF